MRRFRKETVIQLQSGIVAIKGYMKSMKSESVVFVLKIYFLFRLLNQQAICIFVAAVQKEKYYNKFEKNLLSQIQRTFKVE
jgi:hypothetical protein